MEDSGPPGPPMYVFVSVLLAAIWLLRQTLPRRK